MGTCSAKRIYNTSRNNKIFFKKKPINNNPTVYVMDREEINIFSEGNKRREGSTTRVTVNVIKLYALKDYNWRQWQGWIVVQTAGRLLTASRFLCGRNSIKNRSSASMCGNCIISIILQQIFNAFPLSKQPHDVERRSSYGPLIASLTGTSPNRILIIFQRTRNEC